METQISRNSVVNSLWWKILERIFAQGVSIIIQIILARLIEPDQFGILAIIVAITNYAGIFVQSGLSTAIVQKNKLDPLDIGTLLVSSLAIACFMYLLLFVAAPFIAEGYNLTELIWPLRVISLILFFNAINSIQTALYFREMRFKSLFFRSALAIPLSGAVGIIMAYADYGVWSLVAYTIVNIVVVIVYMTFDKKVKMNISFSWSRAKSLYSFSGKIMMSNMVSGFGDTFRTMIIGGKYTTENLAYYDKAYTYSNYVTQSVTMSLSTVLLPTFSRAQDDMTRLKAMARKSVGMTAFLIIPVLSAVAVMAKPLVLLLLTEMWAPSIPFLAIFCLLRMPGCFTTVDKQVFYALGNSTVNMLYELFFLVLNLIMLYITVPIGIMAIAIGATINELIGCIIIFIISKKIFHYSLKERFKDLIMPIVYSSVMVTAIYLISLLGLTNLLTVIIQMFIGLIVYSLLAYLAKDPNLDYIVNIIKEQKGNNLKK